MSRATLEAYKPSFHGTDNAYMLPNDATEQQRLVEQAAAWKALMHSKIVHAPVQDPKRIMDVGCGPGEVTRDLAALFPGAKVYGIDLSVLPEHDASPSNVEFVHGDVRNLFRSDARLAPGTLDYSYSRLLVLGVTDWAAYVRSVAEALRSGGWAEMHEMDYHITEDGADADAEWPWLPEITRAAWDTKKLDARCSQKLEGWMRDAGLVDVQTVRYRMPVGFWDVEKNPQTRLLAEYLAKWWPAVMWLCIPSLMGSDADKAHVEDMKERMLKDLESAQAGHRKAYEIVVCFGRKP